MNAEDEGIFSYRLLSEANYRAERRLMELSANVECLMIARTPDRANDSTNLVPIVLVILKEVAQAADKDFILRNAKQFLMDALIVKEIPTEVLDDVKFECRLSEPLG